MPGIIKLGREKVYCDSEIAVIPVCNQLFPLFPGLGWLTAGGGMRPSLYGQKAGIHFKGMCQ